MKHMMKKLISLIMVLILLLGSFAGCEHSDDQNAKSNEFTEVTEEEKKYLLDIYRTTFGIKEENMTSVMCWGNNNGIYAVLLSIKYAKYSSANCEVVGGLDFVYGDYRPLYVVYEGKYYRLSEAYENGLLNDEALRSLFEKCRLPTRQTYTLDDNFCDNIVNVSIMPSYNFVKYTPESFPEIDCISVEDLETIDASMIGKSGRWLRITIEGHSKQNVLDAVEALYKRVDVQIVSPKLIEKYDATPNDEFYSGYDPSQWAIDKISLPAAWDISKGSASILIGVIDTGIKIPHTDLDGRIDQGLSQYFVSGVSTALDDTDSHGTRVAGIIGAATDNTSGVAGVCWYTSLVSLRVGIDEFDFEVLDEAIEYARDNNIPIINISGGTTDSRYINHIKEAMESYNGLIVCSAGNSNSNNDSYVRYPCNSNAFNVISVGASTEDDKKYPTSNFSATKVDLFAPGDEILTVDIAHSNRYDYLYGTSAAAPFVAGVAALLLANNPDLKPHEIRCIIMRNVDCGDDNCDECSCDDGVKCDNCEGVFWGLCVSGGRLNAYKALSDTTQGHLFEHQYNLANSYAHIRECECCEYLCTYADDIVEEYSYVNTGNSSTHRIVCDTCDYYYQGNHTFYLYTNLGPVRGHNVTCGECGYYYVEQHYWKGVVGGFVCSRCGCQSSTPVIGPGIMSDDDEEKTE